MIDAVVSAMMFCSARPYVVPSARGGSATVAESTDFGGTIGNAPQRRDRAARAGREKRAAEALNAFASQQCAALGVAGTQNRELDALQRQVVRFFEEQVIRSGRSCGRRREEDARLLDRIRVRGRVSGDVKNRSSLRVVQPRLSIRGAEEEERLAAELGGDSLRFIGSRSQSHANRSRFIERRGSEDWIAKRAQLL